jgi:hypothetical protein
VDDYSDHDHAKGDRVGEQQHDGMVNSYPDGNRSYRGVGQLLSEAESYLACGSKLEGKAD